MTSPDRGWLHDDQCPTPAGTDRARRLHWIGLTSKRQSTYNRSMATSWLRGGVVAALLMAAGACAGKVSNEGAGAAAGAGGSGGTQNTPQCSQDSDCKLVSDCCRCEAMSSSSPTPECSSGPCFTDACPTESVTAAACVNTSCVKAKSCAGTVTCGQAKPACPAGQTPLVSGGCWGACVNASECLTLDNCDACSSPGFLCVQEYGPNRKCVPVPVACTSHINCDCLKSYLCPKTQCWMAADAGHEEDVMCVQPM